MTEKRSARRAHPLWWTAALFASVITMVLVCLASFVGTFRAYVPVTLASDRAGLVMESGAKVKMRGVEVGRVATVTGENHAVRLRLELFPNQIAHIPANVEAEIRATTAFGAKYVELIDPPDPSPQRIHGGAVLRSRNVATEVNTVFDNLVALLRRIEVPKLNAVLTALADGVRGQGERMGEAITAADEVLQSINPRMDTVAADWRSLRSFSDAYSAAAQDILSIFDGASTTSETVSERATDLEAMLLATIGVSYSGLDLLAPNKDALVGAIDRLEPTTALLLRHNPVYTCTIQGAKLMLDKTGYHVTGGGNGYSLITDTALLFGDELYRYPDNLPTVAAKGGPGGKPGCGSLPDVAKNFPVRQLITNTGWGTGVDWRPNPGIGRTCAVDFFPVTRAVPEAPHVGECLPGPAPGPDPAYPGGPPYGAPWYGPDGTPLYPDLPGPPEPVTAECPTSRGCGP